MNIRSGTLHPVAILILLGGCGAQLPAPTAALQDRLQDEELADVERHAPDLLNAARAQLTRALSAQERGDSHAVADYTTEARLLFDAAFAESHRVRFEERKLRAMRRLRRAEQVALDYKQTRTRVNNEVARARALVVAQAQAQKAMQAAIAEEERRPLGNKQRRQAANILLSRASLTLSAARALGAPNPSITAAEQALKQAGSKSQARVALRAADKAWWLAQHALAQARKAKGSPMRDEYHSFVQDLKHAGFMPIGQEHGLVIELSKALAVPGPLAQTRSDLRKLSRALVSHPHGVIQVEVGSVPAQKKKAQLHAKRVANALAKLGLDRARLVETHFDTRSEPVARLVLPAYVLTP